jgi:hypothetical protein
MRCHNIQHLELKILVIILKGLTWIPTAPADAGPKQRVTELVNKELMAQLAEMGFPEVRAEKGLWLTGNESLENAINWLAEHSEDADIDVPLEVDAATANKVIFTCHSPDAANCLSCNPASVFPRVGFGFRV